VLAEQLERLLADARRLLARAVRLRDYAKGARRDLRREAGAGVAHRLAVQVLDRGDGQAAADEPGDRGAAGGHAVEEADDRERRLGRGHELEPDGRDHAERPL